MFGEVRVLVCSPDRTADGPFGNTEELRRGNGVMVGVGNSEAPLDVDQEADQGCNDL